MSILASHSGHFSQPVLRIDAGDENDFAVIFLLFGQTLSDDFVSSLSVLLQNIQAVSLPFDSASNVNLTLSSYTYSFAHRSVARM